MIIKVQISEETWARMLTGRRVEGTIGYDKWTGRKDFNMFHRRSRSRLRDKLIKKLPWGWLKESEKKQKLFLSVDKDMPLEDKLRAFGDDHDAAMETIIDMEIIDRN